MIDESVRSSRAYKVLLDAEKSTAYAPMIIVFGAVSLLSLGFVLNATQHGDPHAIASLNPLSFPVVWLFYGVLASLYPIGRLWMKAIENQFDRFVEGLAAYGEPGTVLDGFFVESKDSSDLTIPEFIKGSKGGYRTSDTAIITQHWLFEKGRLGIGRWHKLAEITYAMIDTEGGITMTDKKSKRLRIRVQRLPHGWRENSLFGSGLQPEWKKVRQVLAWLKQASPDAIIEGLSWIPKEDDSKR